MVHVRHIAAGVAALSGVRGVVATCEPGETTKQDDAVGSDDSDLFDDYPAVEKADDGPDLRILPLGASIMSGVGSPEHSGFVPPRVCRPSRRWRANGA